MIFRSRLCPRSRFIREVVGATREVQGEPRGLSPRYPGVQGEPRGLSPRHPEVQGEPRGLSPRYRCAGINPPARCPELRRDKPAGSLTGIAPG